MSMITRERQLRGERDKDRLMLLLLMLTISAETDEVNNDAGDDEPYYVTLSLPRSRASSSEPRVINVARHVTDACDYAAVYLPLSFPSPSLLTSSIFALVIRCASATVERNLHAHETSSKMHH